MNDILEHAWFKSSRFYNSTGPGWHALRNKKAEAPFVPDIKGPTDTTYFQPEGPYSRTHNTITLQNMNTELET